MKKIASVLFFVTAILYFCLLLIPFLFTLSASFMSKTDLQTYYFSGNNISYLKVIPDQIVLSQYHDAILKNTEFTRAFVNTLLYASISSILTLVIAIPTSYTLSFYKFRFRKFFIFIVIILMLIPYQALEIPHFFILRRLGILGKDISVILTNIFNTFEMVLLLIFFKTVDEDSLNAARVDGANNLACMFSIALPQIKNGIVIVFILKFATVWSLIEQPLMFLEDPTHFPLSLVITTLCQKHVASAFGFCMVSLLPLAIIFLLFQKQLKELIENV